MFNEVFQSILLSSGYFYIFFGVSHLRSLFLHDLTASVVLHKKSCYLVKSVIPLRIRLMNLSGKHSSTISHLSNVRVQGTGNH